MGKVIRIAGIIPESFTDGIGIRYTIFTQGCSHHCHGCQNPETWDFNSGTDTDISDILKDIKDNPLLDGVTFSGGDPIYQAKNCTELAKLIKSNTNLNIWCYTGFKFEDLLSMEDAVEFMKYIDVLVDGEYKESQRCLALPFRGSSNQRIIDIPKTLESNSIVLKNL